jgi:hypothetical protein
MQWASPHRLLVMSGPPFISQAPVVVNPRTWLVVRRIRWRGRVLTSEETQHRLVLLAAPPAPGARRTLGPARLVHVTIDGGVSSVQLDRIEAGEVSATTGGSAPYPRGWPSTGGATAPSSLSPTATWSPRSTCAAGASHITISSSLPLRRRATGPASRPHHALARSRQDCHLRRGRAGERTAAARVARSLRSQTGRHAGLVDPDGRSGGTDLRRCGQVATGHALVHRTKALPDGRRRLRPRGRAAPAVASRDPMLSSGPQAALACTWTWEITENAAPTSSTSPTTDHPRTPTQATDPAPPIDASAPIETNQPRPADRNPPVAAHPAPSPSPGCERLAPRATDDRKGRGGVPRNATGASARRAKRNSGPECSLAREAQLPRPPTPVHAASIGRTRASRRLHGPHLCADGGSCPE